eukprot:g4458.t1
MASKNGIISEETKEEDVELFQEIASRDFLKFEFAGSTYADSLERAIKRTSKLCAISAKERTLPSGQRVIWMSHDFSFLGGSLGCGEGEKLVLGFERALRRRLPVVVECKSGGARMQEGTLSLMQMAKISVAVRALRSVTPAVPFVSVLRDPTYGGVSASYAMQADVKIGAKGARVGFAGPGVILDTMYEKNQTTYDAEAPDNFQSAEYLKRNGQLDAVVEDDKLEEAVDLVLGVLSAADAKVSAAFSSKHTEADSKTNALTATTSAQDMKVEDIAPGSTMGSPAAATTHGDYTKSRLLTRPQCQDLIREVFSSKHWFELAGDGRVGDDACIRGGLAVFDSTTPCVVVANFKGHTPADMKKANYGMGTPHGYRKAKRLMELAERFQLPVVTFVDTCGAKPSFDCEKDGQSEAIATNLTLMAGLKTPIVTVVVGEGGSGGALGIAVADRIGMLSNAYYGVISPEGAASILGRYDSDAHKQKQYPLDCKILAKAQAVHAEQLKTLGVVDEVLLESAEETFERFPKLKSRVSNFLRSALKDLATLSETELVAQRYRKFRAMGEFQRLDTEAKRRSRVEECVRIAKPSAKRRRKKKGGAEDDPATRNVRKLLHFVVDRTIANERAIFRGGAPKAVDEYAEHVEYPSTTFIPVSPSSAPKHTAKAALDRGGPNALVAYVREKAKNRVLVTDTTFRDAHQSLLATRVRTFDLINAANLPETKALSSKLFSMEVWGGATFDVSIRFLHEDPWERLRRIRKALPDVCLQMLFRGSNAVGYRSYPDNVVVEFVRLASKNGIDIFRIFDCFNSVDQMRVAIDAVKKCGKVAEVCVCFSGDFLDVEKEKIYTLEYFADTAKRCVEAGAHMLCVKDMAGLLKPGHAGPLMKAIRSVTDVPVHFHTHSTSGASLASALAMAQAGCEIVDTAISSMSDCTSQPSMNAFLATLEKQPRDPKIDHLELTPVVKYWQNVRELYEPFENGMRCGNAKVYDHQIPGGQYSNLMVQCKAMGLWDRWEEVVDMCRDVNRLFGDIIKVTPSSKVVGDMSLYLINSGLSVADVEKRGEEIAWPASVVNLCRGLLGAPHHGLPPKIVSSVLKSAGVERMTKRPGAILKDADMEAVRKSLSESDWPFERKVSDEDVVSSLLYDKVFADYVSFVREFGEVTRVPSSIFWYGCIPGSGATFATSDDDASCTTSVVLSRVGPIVRGSERDLHFVVDKKTDAPWTIRAEDDWESKMNGSGGVMADPNDTCQVPSPLVGKVEALMKIGGKFAKGDTICVVCAMKMEVAVKAPFDCLVRSHEAKVGDSVEEGSLLMRIVGA